MKLKVTENRVLIHFLEVIYCNQNLVLPIFKDKKYKKFQF